jgi:hypothetical protein
MSLMLKIINIESTYYTLVMMDNMLQIKIQMLYHFLILENLNFNILKILSFYL